MTAGATGSLEPLLYVITGIGGDACPYKGLGDWSRSPCLNSSITANTDGEDGGFRLNVWTWSLIA